MNCSINPSSINQTFIIEPLSVTGGTPTFSACTSLYTDNIISCSGNTQIFMGSGIITFDGSIYTNQDLSANTINASTYFSGGTNLIDIINSVQITGGTFNNITDTLTLEQINGNQINVTGFTDYYTTGSTLIGTTAYFDRTDLLSAYTLNLSSLNVDTYVTGVTFNNNQLIITRNDGVNLNTFINSFTGLTVNGSLNANTISATTYLGLPVDVRVTGGTYNAGTATFRNNTGGTFSVTGFSIGNTASNGLTKTGNNIELGGSLTSGIFIDGAFPITFGPVTPLTDFVVNTGTVGTQCQLNISSSFIELITTDTGGTQGTGLYADQIGFGIHAYTASSTNSSFYVLNSSVSYPDNGSNNYIIIEDTIGLKGAIYTADYSANFTPESLITQRYVSGVTSGITGIYTTGFTLNNSTYDLTIRRNDNVNLTVNLGTLASDVNITGGTYNNNTGVVTFYNNTGGTFNVSGFTTGMTDTTVTSFSYDNANKFTIGDSTGGTFTATINNVTGLTVNGSLSATTYLGLPVDIRVTGGTYSAGTATFRNNTGGTFTVTGFSTGGSGGGDSITGGTYDNSTGTLTLSTTGSSIYITGFTTGSTSSTQFTGGTVSGATNFTGGLTADTFSASTYLGLPLNRGSFGITVDGSGAVITNGVKGYLVMPYNATITGWDIIGNVSGDCMVDIWKNTTIPTSADTITGTETPYLNNQQINSDNNLTNFNTGLFINDILAFNVISASTVSRINVIIKVIKT